MFLLLADFFNKLRKEIQTNFVFVYHQNVKHFSFLAQLRLEPNHEREIERERENGHCNCFPVTILPSGEAPERVFHRFCLISLCLKVVFNDSLGFRLRFHYSLYVSAFSSDIDSLRRGSSKGFSTSVV